MTEQNQENIVVEVREQPRYNAITDEHLKIIRVSKSVKMFSFIDMFFLFINAIVYPYLFLIFLMPLAGWRGATIFNKWYSIIYMLFIILEIILKLYFSQTPLSWFSAFISLTILGYVTYFVALIWDKAGTYINDLRMWGQRPEMKMCGFI